jgi:hypothetical protein
MKETRTKPAFFVPVGHHLFDGEVEEVNVIFDNEPVPEKPYLKYMNNRIEFYGKSDLQWRWMLLRFVDIYFGGNDEAKDLVHQIEENSENYFIIQIVPLEGQ